MHVFIVRAECGDYYCGCGGGHLIGIYSEIHRARLALSHSIGLKHKSGKWNIYSIGVDSKTGYDAATGEGLIDGARIEQVEVDAAPRESTSD